MQDKKLGVETEMLNPDTLKVKTTTMLDTEKASDLNETSKLAGGAATRGPAPRDRWRAVFLIFYLLGLATLLPWNFFITAQQYWMYKFRDLNSTNETHFDDPSRRSSLQTTFTGSLSMASMIPNTVFLMLNTILSRRIPLRLRLVVTLVIIVVLFIFTTVLVMIDTNEWQFEFFVITLLTVVLLNSTNAIFQGALFGVAARFPPQITEAIMNGQAVGGIFASLAAILSLAGGSSPTSSAFGYFLTPVLTLSVCVVAYLNLGRFEFYRFYLQGTAEEGTELSPQASNRSKNVPLLYIFKKIKVYAISVCVVFLGTLAIFPAVTVLVASTSDEPEWKGKYFIPVGCFLLYNVGDLCGRLAAGMWNLPRNGIVLLPVLSVIRLVFIPLIMFCNASPRHFSSAFFTHDAYFMLFMILMSLSNGYLASQAMIHGPKDVEPEHQEAAGGMMAFFLGVGLMLGSALSNAFVKLL